MNLNESEKELLRWHQLAKFAGVGAHHQNAQAERAIRTIMLIARTMMIHAGIHWPEVSDPTLWPMAVNQACFCFNRLPSPVTGLSPSDLFTKTRWPQKRLHDIHVWGCPLYVLNKSIQDGKKIPKWRPRSSRYVHMGNSISHSSSVPLGLNLSTGSITAQLHVVFDDWFATVGSDSKDIPDFQSLEWEKYLEIRSINTFWMSSSLADKYCEHFDLIIAKLDTKEYLRQPTVSDLKSINELHKAVHGVEGMLGSLDCMYTVWKNCPKAWQGSFKGKEKVCSIVLEAACDYHMWFWHCSYGYAGTLNDKSIFDLSPLLKSFIDGSLEHKEDKVGPFEIGGQEFLFMYLLTDGIYPAISRFVKGFPIPKILI